MTYDEALVHYRNAATASGIELKGKTMPYTSLNGNMFSFLDRTGTLCLRLDPDAREEFMAEHRTAPVEQYGKVMKHYAAVPPTMLADDTALAAAFALSLAHARTLKAKPTRRR